MFIEIDISMIKYLHVQFSVEVTNMKWSTIKGTCAIFVVLSNFLCTVDYGCGWMSNVHDILSISYIDIKVVISPSTIDNRS